MINVIHDGGDVFNAFLYPEQNAVHSSYFQNQVTGFGNVLNETGQRFMEAARNIYDKINDSAAIEMARRAIRHAQGIFNPNTIIAMDRLEYIQAAQPTMQRWIMASPDVRELYQQQRCHGFADTYLDVEPNTIRENQYDYRRVMSGVVVEDEHDWHADIYFDELRPGDRELTHHEKVDILSTWEVMSMFIKQGNDPTDPYGGKL